MNREYLGNSRRHNEIANCLIGNIRNNVMGHGIVDGKCDVVYHCFEMNSRACWRGLFTVETIRGAYGWIIQDGSGVRVCSAKMMD